MNASANSPGIVQRLVRALNLRGDVSQELKSLLPSIQLLNLDDPAFWSGQVGGRLMEGAVVLPAVAGQNAYAHLANADPSVMAVVESLILSNHDAATTVQMRWGITAIQGVYAVAGNKVQRDDRQPVPGGAALSAYTPVGGNAAAPTGVPGNSILVPKATSVIIPGQWVLTGQNSLEVLCGTVNIFVTVGFTWRERRILPSER